MEHSITTDGFPGSSCLSPSIAFQPLSHFSLPYWVSSLHLPHITGLAQSWWAKEASVEGGHQFWVLL